MWNAIVEGISPHLVAGAIMVAAMGVMVFVHKVYGNKHKPGPQDPLEVLKIRFARGEIGRDEYEERRAVLASSASAEATRSVARSAWPA